jgi:hypothetical protein
MLHHSLYMYATYTRVYVIYRCITVWASWYWQDYACESCGYRGMLLLLLLLLSLHTILAAVYRNAMCC